MRRKNGETDSDPGAYGDTVSKSDTAADSHTDPGSGAESYI